jgi:hypothetical protein
MAAGCKMRNLIDLSISKVYRIRFGCRILVLAAIGLLAVFWPQSFAVLAPGQFGRRFSPLHLVWLLWVGDIVSQMIPVRGRITLGSRKQFPVNYRSAPGGFDREKLQQYRDQSNWAAAKVLALWLAGIAVTGMLWFKGILTRPELLLIAAVFYVCDLFCVLYWCPLQSLLLKNRCCVTCRIYNWDFLMIFSPLVFSGGFFAFSLFGLSLIVFSSWEIRIFKYPERFWDGANQMLKCVNCQDKICQSKNKAAFLLKAKELKKRREL